MWHCNGSAIAISTIYSRSMDKALCFHIVAFRGFHTWSQCCISMTCPKFQHCKLVGFIQMKAIWHARIQATSLLTRASTIGLHTTGEVTIANHAFQLSVMSSLILPASLRLVATICFECSVCRMLSVSCRMKPMQDISWRLVIYYSMSIIFKIIANDIYIY